MVEFPPKLEEFWKFRRLDLSNNNPHEVSDTIGALPALENLNLRRNIYLKYLPESLFRSPTLRVMEVVKPLARALITPGWGDRGIKINDPTMWDE